MKPNRHHRLHHSRPFLGIGLALLQTAAFSAPGGDQLWRFYADFTITVVEPIDDLSGNGGKDLLVGSQDDTLYLVEAKGPKAGNQLWAARFLSTVTAAISTPDLTGDGKPDAVAGDAAGTVKALSGASGELRWAFITEAAGTILSLAAIPDADKDGTGEIVVGSENDTIYCLAGNPGSKLGKVLWRFGAPPLSGKGGGMGGQGGGHGRPKLSASAVLKDGPVGVNSLALLKQGAGAFGVVAGVSNDSVYCLPIAGGTPKWKVGLPGDIWQVVAFPDQDGDGIEEVLLSCGADLGYLLKGSNGAVLWSRAVSMGAVSVAASADMNGDGKADALIGDGGGKVHCVPGNASGANVAAAWTYDFGDLSTIYSIAALGDVDGDGRADCAVGTSNDLVAVLTGKGAKSWSVNMGGSVFSVASLGDLDGNGAVDVAAGTETGFAAAYQGFGTTSALLDPRLAGARAAAGADPRARIVRLSSGSGVTVGIRDLRGRRLHALSAETRK